MPVLLFCLENVQEQLIPPFCCFLKVDSLLTIWIQLQLNSITNMLSVKMYFKSLRPIFPDFIYRIYFLQRHNLNIM